MERKGLTGNQGIEQSCALCKKTYVEMAFCQWNRIRAYRLKSSKKNVEATSGALQVNFSMKERKRQVSSSSEGEVDCLYPGQEQVHILGNRSFRQKSYAEVVVQGVHDEKQCN